MNVWTSIVDNPTISYSWLLCLCPETQPSVYSIRSSFSLDVRWFEGYFCTMLMTSPIDSDWKSITVDIYVVVTFFFKYGRLFFHNHRNRFIFRLLPVCAARSLYVLLEIKLLPFLKQCYSIFAFKFPLWCYHQSSKQHEVKVGIYESLIILIINDGKRTLVIVLQQKFECKYPTSYLFLKKRYCQISSQFPGTPFAD